MTGTALSDEMYRRYANNIIGPWKEGNTIYFGGSVPSDYKYEPDWQSPGGYCPKCGAIFALLDSECMHCGAPL
jgi:hypothetical protein